MMTVKQVSGLTGVSVRTLQFYDEIGLFKPTGITDAGYRLYDDSALEVLQQILFFKELDFTLKEIKAIMDNPHFDKAAAFSKQRELIQIKRDRLNALLELLDKLLKGEKCMDFEDFDMSRYFRVLDEFRETHRDAIVKQLGSMESFDEMVSDLQSRENGIAQMAVKQYGSMEQFTKAAKKNLQDFLENGAAIPQTEVSGLIEKTETLTRRLTSDCTLDPASPSVLKMTGELIAFTNECSQGNDMGDNYWSCMADTYAANPVFIEVTDRKYGDGAAEFISRAIRAWLDMA